MTQRPATYSEVLRIREYRALYTASTLSGVGDQIAKIALAILVFDRTGSSLYAALAYAAAYLPWLVGGPILSPLADRLPRRRVMIVCDLARGALVAAMALPGLPLWVLFALLLVASVLAPPFEAARAATLPDVLEGDRYVVGSSLANITGQLVQVVGFAAGGAIVAVVTARGALLLDAATFLVSAMVLQAGVRARPAAVERRPSLFADAVDGANIVFRRRVLRSILLLAWAGASFAIVPEGLAVPYAASVGAGDVAAGLLTAASPLGTALGALLVGRFVAPMNRLRYMLLLAAMSMVVLLPALARPAVGVAFVLWTLSGFGMAYQLAANAAFVMAVPPEARGRAFGLAQAGLQLFQGLAIALGGLVATAIDPHRAVALAGVTGLACVAALAWRWPHAEIAALMTPAPRQDDVEAEDQVLLSAEWAGPYLLRPESREVIVRLQPLDPD